MYNVTKSAVGLIVNKRVGNRYIEKRVNIRIEHVHHSKCRDDFLKRVQKNLELKKEAKAKGTTLNLKRLPAAPKPGHFVTTKKNEAVLMTPLPYEILI